MGYSNRNRFNLLLLALILLFYTGNLNLTRANGNQPTLNNANSMAKLINNQPISFEPNQGQTDSQVKYLGRGPGYQLFITATDLVMRLAKRAPVEIGPESISDATKQQISELAIKMHFVGASGKAEVIGLNQLETKKNYYKGADQSRWLQNLPTYHSVRLNSLYPGIDALFYGHDEQLEYDLIVSPGADPNSIALQFEGVDQLSIDAQGALVLHVQNNELISMPPVTFQQAGEKRSIASHYRLINSNTVAFSVADYDRSKPLTIDPVIYYNRFFAGNGYDTVQQVITVDGNTFLLGYTTSTDLPVGNQYGVQSKNTQYDIFVASLTADGAQQWLTIFGSSQDELGYGIAYHVDKTSPDVSSSLNLYIVGKTAGKDFPVFGTLSAPQGGFDGFLTVLGATSGAMRFSRYLGGNQNDAAKGVVVDDQSNIYLTGSTTSTDLPASNGFLIQPYGYGYNNTDGFLMKLTPYFQNKGQQQTLYCSYLGADAFKVVLDKFHQAIVLGWTSHQLPYGPKGSQDIFYNIKGPSDYFVLRADASKTGKPSLTGLQYVGGDGPEYPDIGDLKMDDNAGYVYMCGSAGPGNAYFGLYEAQVKGDYDILLGILFDFEYVNGQQQPVEMLLGGEYVVGGSGSDVATGLEYLGHLDDADYHSPFFFSGFTNSTDFPITTGDPLPGPYASASQYTGAFGLLIYLEEKPYKFGMIFNGSKGTSFGQACSYQYVNGSNQVVLVGATDSSDFASYYPAAIPSPDDKPHFDENGFVIKLILDGYIQP